jgi:thioredoxin-related protein
MRVSDQAGHFVVFHPTGSINNRRNRNAESIINLPGYCPFDGFYVIEYMVDHEGDKGG